MLRRALMAAIALSCTLSIPPAHGAQRLAQIKDLICVLVLSGMQKEDLDVSMLRKLQRYNVNIDGMNNEQLRQQCTVKNKDSAGLKKHKIVEEFLSTTETTTETTTVTTEEPSKTLSIEAVVQYLKTQKDSFWSFNETTTTTEKVINLHQEIGKYVSEYPSKLDINLLQRLIEKEAFVERETTPQYNTNKNNNVNTNERIPIALKDVEFIDNIFKDYLVNKQMTSTTTDHPTTKNTVNIKNIYKEIDKLIKNASKEVERENKKKDFNDNTAANSFKNDISSLTHVTNQDQQKSGHGNKGISSIYEFLNLMNRFKTYSSLSLFQDNNTENSRNAYKQEDTLPATKISQNNQIKYEEINSSNTVPSVNVQEKTVSPILVKEIAETVKDVIMKDLRKELSNIYLKPMQTTSNTTTEAPATLALPSTIDIEEKNIAIMDTFMELYEQIKALKRTTYVLEAHNKSEYKVSNDFKQEIKSFPIGQTFRPLVNRIRYPVDFKLPGYPIASYNTKQFVNLDPYVPKQIMNHRSPITIQTNSIEIRPLAVPLTKPESMIRQNIVVHPRLSTQNDRYNQIYPQQYNYQSVRSTHRNKTQYYSSIERHDRYNEKRNSLPYVYRKPIYIEEDVRLRMSKDGKSQLDTDYYEKINIDNNGSKINHRNRIIRNHNIPKFHERLEGIDDRPRVNIHRDIIHTKGSNNEVPSRQQLSLIDMKKGTSYDDTHFKNFLKSQQKVTDILERILANRPKANKPSSDEAKFFK